MAHWGAREEKRALVPSEHVGVSNVLVEWADCGRESDTWWVDSTRFEREAARGWPLLLAGGPEQSCLPLPAK